jgi:chromosome segregation ATPase
VSLAEQVAELERELARTKEALKDAEDEHDAAREEADDLRVDLAAAERELANRDNELPAGLARIIKPWLTKTAVASRAELIDALPREHEALAQFLRAIA